ncbi:MAG: hypothetical protein M1832_003242 [Thelocarpon impressellum]|nr:MAG: hypothetical protein M1832_003242 [Thelocarpon impressellum]
MPSYLTSVWAKVASPPASPCNAFPPTQTKITKPRTNNNSSSNLLSQACLSPVAPVPPPKDLSEVPFEYVSDDEIVVTSVTGDRRSRQDTRHVLRTHLFGQDEQKEVSRREENTGRRSGEVLERVSRSSSEKALPQLPSASASSERVDSLDGSQLSLGLETDATKSSSGSPPQERSDGRPLRVTSGILHDARYVPIRRKTMLVPGIATRGGPINVLRKPPPQEYMQSQEDREFYYNAGPRRPPPSAGLTAFNAALDGRAPTGTRSSTPCDLDYSPLGGLLRGTLRITNGTASPAPSLFSHASAKDEVQTEHVAPAVKELPRTIHVQPTPRKATPRPLQLLTVRTDRDSLPSMVRLTDGEETTGAILQSAHVRINEGTSITDADRQQTPCRDIPRQPTIEVSQRSPDRAAAIAQEYISEIPSSPYSFAPSRDGSLFNLVATTRSCPIADGLFDEDEGIETSPVRAETFEDSRGEALRILDGAQQPQPDDAVSLSFSSKSEKLAAELMEACGKPLGKSDSGYSSHTSLRARERECLDVSDVSDVSRPSSEMRSAIVSEVSPASSEAGEERRQEVVVDPPPHPLRSAPPLPSKISVQAQAEHMRPVGAEYSIRLEAPVEDEKLPIRESHPPAVNGSSSPCSPRKLQKARRTSQPGGVPPDQILVTACREIIREQIPPVPVEVAERLAERLRRFPALEHTYPSLQHTTSLESLLSEDPAGAVVAASIYADDGERRLSLDAVNRLQDSGCPAMERRCNSRGSPSQMQFITDFGTVAESLGASPYDVAIHASGQTARPRRNSAHADRHPHQMGGMPRPRAIVGMSEETASALARVRSRDVVRPQSTYDTPSASNTGREAWSFRPQSLATHTPPMPSLPGQDRWAGSLRASLPNTLAPPTTSPERAPTKASATPTSSPVSPWDAHRRAWRARRESASEGLRASTSGSRLSTQQQHQTPMGRYEGGLEYNYAPGSGVVGSAGSTPSRNSGAARKSVAVSRQYGVDLSDVPVFVVG